MREEDSVVTMVIEMKELDVRYHRDLGNQYIEVSRRVRYKQAT
jgi:hypothetical protein